MTSIFGFGSHSLVAQGLITISTSFNVILFYRMLLIGIVRVIAG
jgi:hypothetical protein